MAMTPLGAESAPANIPTDWTLACDRLAMARVDALEDVDSDEEIMLLGGAHAEAGHALLATPAPDWQALRFKLEVFRDEETFNLIEECVVEILNGLIADVDRLQREARRGN